MRHCRRIMASPDPTNTWKIACQLWDSGQLKKAFEAMRRAAIAGEPSAQVNLGYLYDEGIGIRKSQEKAAYWYRRAVKYGNASAANNLGVMYRQKGRNALAKRWFSRALQLGDDDAHLQLAVLYMEKQDQRLAKKHLQKLLTAKSIPAASRKKATRLLQELSKP